MNAAHPFSGTISRIRQIRDGHWNLRTALGMIEFELSGRPDSPMHRRTRSEVDAVRREAINLLFTCTTIA